MSPTAGVTHGLIPSAVVAEIHDLSEGLFHSCSVGKSAHRVLVFSQEHSLMSEDILAKHSGILCFPGALSIWTETWFYNEDYAVFQCGNFRKAQSTIFISEKTHRPLQTENNPRDFLVHGTRKQGD